MDPLPSEKPMGGLSDLIGIQKEPIRPVNPFAPKSSATGILVPQKQTGLRPIRTYESDVAEYVQVGNSPSGSNNKIIAISLSILLFLAAGSIVAYLFLGKAKDAPTSIRVGTTQVKTIILADVQKELDTSIIEPTRFREVLINERKNSSLPLGKILAPFATRHEGQATVLVPVDAFMDMVGLRIGAQLSRSLDPEFMFGIHSYDGNQPFLILKTQSYGSAFTGMLEWESRLGDDLRDLFFDQQVGTPLPTIWSDSVFENKDLRVLRDGTKTRLLYSLIDKNTIVITTNEQTFKEILSRFYSASLVR
jgi:hypothetical protein